MQKVHAGSGGAKPSCAAIVIRDALVLILCLAVFAAVYRLAPQVLRGSASHAEEPTASGVSASGTDETAGRSAAGQSPQAAEETPALTPPATPQPTPENPTANGDFSAVFPAYDTGADALYSYQTDTVRIAIDRVQANGITYFVADVWVRSIDAFRTAFAKGAYGRGLHEMPLKIAKDNQAVFAVTGDYYGAREQGVVVRNGVLYRDVMSDDVCILKTDGTLNVYEKSSFSTIGMLDDAVWQAWAFGPALVEGCVACDTSGSKIKVKNPRCAIGYYEPGHYCFLVADGRQSGYSDGMTLDELADAFVSLGCKTAYNLDGGATATMVFSGAVVNQPVNGGRSSSDIICFPADLVS